VRYRLQQNDVKIVQKSFRFGDIKKSSFAGYYASKRTLEIKSEMKSNEAKKAIRNETEPKNRENKSQKLNICLIVAEIQTFNQLYVQYYEQYLIFL
jgi:hypothetical protein